MSSLSQLHPGIALNSLDQINDKVAFPLTGTALNPDLVGITLATTLTLLPGTTSTDRDSASAQAVSAAEDYMNNLRIGDTLVINEIADRIRNSSTKILDVGEPNHQIDSAVLCTIGGTERR